MKNQLYKWGIPILLFLLLLPLFRVNVTGLHGWGGDFSQYIHQAINIVDHKPVADIGYIYNENHPSLAPSAYPIGFPMLLAPVYAFFGNNMMVFMTFMALLLFLLGLLSFYFFRLEFGVLGAFLGTLILVYNPWIIDFKGNVLSDIPFTFFFLLSAATYVFWKNKRFPLLIGLIVGFTILIRTVGIVLLIAIVLDKLMTIILAYRNKENTAAVIKAAAKDGLPIIISASLFVPLFHQIIFPLPEENNYSAIISSANNFDYLVKNFHHYIHLTTSYFTLNKESSLTGLSFWIFSILGLVGILTQKKNTIFFLLLALGIFGIILLFPYQQGFRYVYPIVPFLIYFFLLGCKKVFYKPKYNQIFIATFLLLTLFLYVPNIIKLQKRIDATPLTSGPQVAVAQEVFHYIRKNVPEAAIIVYNKPRVLSLYSDRAAMGNSFLEPDDLQRKFLEKNIDYILINHWLAGPDSSLDLYIKKYRESHLDSIWSNSRYVLYQFRKNAPIKEEMYRISN